MAEDDLESDWDELRSIPHGPLVLVSGKVGDVKAGLEMAAAMTLAVLQPKYEATVVSEVVREFTNQWIGDLRSRGPAALVEVLLEDEKLSLDDLKGFVRALPAAVLQRILDHGATMEKVRGIHALLSIEHLWRTQRGTFRRDYLLGRNLEGTLSVTVYPANRTEELHFALDETFDLRGVST